jgi:hypothetical protein
VGTPVHWSQPGVDTVDSSGDGDEETVELVQQNLESDLTRNVLDWLRTSVLYTPLWSAAVCLEAVFCILSTGQLLVRHSSILSQTICLSGQLLSSHSANF